jgi:hypothetical protein
MNTPKVIVIGEVLQTGTSRAPEQTFENPRLLLCTEIDDRHTEG